MSYISIYLQKKKELSAERHTEAVCRIYKKLCAELPIIAHCPKYQVARISALHYAHATWAHVCMYCKSHTVATWHAMMEPHFNGLARDCSNSALGMMSPQSCAKPST